MKSIFFFLLVLGFLEADCQKTVKTVKEDPNSIAYTDKDGDQFRLISVGDKVPKLFLNGRELDREELANYSDLLEILQQQLEQKRQAQAGRQEGIRQETFQAIVKQMVDDKLIPGNLDIVSFRLDNGGFMINGKEQSWPVYQKYKAMFQVSSTQFFHYNVK